MTFQSLEYLIFLPVVFILYWTLCRGSKTLQNGLIVAASLVFYGWWDWRFLGLLLLTAFSTFLAGMWMGGTDDEKKLKWINIGAIVLNIGILFFFKYFNFFVQSFADAFSLFGAEMNVHTLKILLPVGISFYTFSALSYSIDVYQRKVEPTRDLLAYLAYVTFFPSILSGPISRAQKQLPQYFQTRVFDYDKAVSACKLMLWGGVIKLCLADRLGIYVDAVYANIAQHNGTTLFLTSVFYTIQIYADFAGYSLMAIGSGRLLGIELPTNFIRPYFAKTVTDFWRRWHISLTTWFRDYIYFPLGGNRCSKARWMLNTMIVFTVSGLWHGAAWTFLVWGALHGIGLILHKLHLKYGISKGSKAGHLFCMLFTFGYACLCWVFFRADSLNEAWLVLTQLFSCQTGILQPYTWTFFSLLLLTTCSIYYSIKKQTFAKNAKICYPVLPLNKVWGLTVFFLLCGLTIGLAYVGNTAFIYGAF